MSPRSAALLRALLLLVATALAAASCARGTERPPPESSTSDGLGRIPAGVPRLRAGESAVPWHGIDGNRFVPGAEGADLDGPVDVPVGVEIGWLVGTVLDGAPLWVGVGRDGMAFSISLPPTGPPRVLPLGPTGVETPPVLAADDGSLELLVPAPGESAVAAPLLVGGRRLAVSGGGGLLIDGASIPGVEPLPDAALAVNDAGLVAVLSSPTDRYPHGVLGDPLEAANVTIVDPARQTADQIAAVAPGEVIEGTGAMWADIDGDGVDEILVTVSTPALGARLVAYGEDGRIVAESDPIGRGSRWRHQVAVAPVGPAGEIEVIDVLTPHLGGVVEFFRRSGDRLELVASVGGYTSHFIASRNLSLPVVADLDGDGRFEVVLASQDRHHLGGIVRTRGGAEVAWSVDLGGELSSNLSVVAYPDGAAVAAARRDGVIRIWPGSG